MIGRKSTYLLSSVMQTAFANRTTMRGQRATRSQENTLFDFLFLTDQPEWLCQGARDCLHYNDSDALREYILGLHTGVSILPNRTAISSEKKREMGQKVLLRLAESVVEHWDELAEQSFHLLGAEEHGLLARQLDLDGYHWTGKSLLCIDGVVLDTDEKTTLLRDLYRALGLANEDTSFRFLALAETGYVEERWKDAIGNARSFLENVLFEIADKVSMTAGSGHLSGGYKAIDVRKFLVTHGVLTDDEAKAVGDNYGLLSNAGSHRRMAEYDEASLMYQMVLILAHFAMLRCRRHFAPS